MPLLACNSRQITTIMYRCISSVSDTPATKKIYSGRVRRWGAIFGILGIPWLSIAAYEHFVPLPDAIATCPYPVLARYFIRRSLWCENIEDAAYYLDQAMRAVLRLGYGAASPQATGLAVYLSELYLQQEPPSKAHLLASFAALTHKPHIGEAVSEERSRLEMSFKVADRLLDIIPWDAHEQRHEIARKVLMTMEKAPKYLSKGWQDHPLKGRFLGAINTK
jgi:hypothetical protein